MCDICKGWLWVCESHPSAPANDEIEGGCECGPGMACVCNPKGALPPGVEIIFGEDPAFSEYKGQIH